MDIFYITDTDVHSNDGIKKVFVRSIIEKDGKQLLSKGEWISKYLVVDRIKEGDIFRTAWKSRDGKWVLGKADVHIVGSRYLRTDRNNTEKDNLKFL